MADKLHAGVRVLALAQPGEVFRFDCAAEIPFLGEPALPLAMTLLVATPIVLLRRCELARVVGARLAG
jgi:hypothetical protein